MVLYKGLAGHGNGNDPTGTCRVTNQAKKRRLNHPESEQIVCTQHVKTARTPSPTAKSETKQQIGTVEGKCRREQHSDFPEKYQQL